MGRFTPQHLDLSPPTLLDSLSPAHFQCHTPSTRHPRPQRRSHDVQCENATLRLRRTMMSRSRRQHLESSPRPERPVLDLTNGLLDSTTPCRHSLQVHRVRECIKVIENDKKCSASGVLKSQWGRDSTSAFPLAEGEEDARCRHLRWVINASIDDGACNEPTFGSSSDLGTITSESSTRLRSHFHPG